MDPVAILLFATAATVVGFALTFFVARRIRNFGIVDIAWAGGFAPLACFYAATLDGAPARRGAVALLAAGWSLRLAGLLARRVWDLHPEEDGRYQQLRRDWGSRVDVKMFLFFQAQGLLLVLLSAPFFLSARNPAAGAHPLEIAGAVLWLAALVGETVADAQLARFKRDPANRGRVCDAGLWRWSRHPNYFCEWLVWVAFALFAAPSPAGWLAAFCPALMLFLLLKVTGIEATEQQLLRSKGEAYRAYQRRTSPFVPWFPRPS